MIYVIVKGKFIIFQDMHSFGFFVIYCKLTKGLISTELLARLWAIAKK